MTIPSALQTLLGPELEKRGFQYKKTQASLLWEYRKQLKYGNGVDKETITQRITIQKHRTFPMLFLNLEIGGDFAILATRYTLATRIRI